MDNFTLTRSLLAENSPYFLTGAKITYDSPNKKWTIAGLIVNGWQRIQRLEGNSLPSFGTQIYFTPNNDVILNWSNFIGTDDPDTTRRMRFFNNLYGQFQITENLQMVAGFDIGIQQQSKNSTKYDIWFSPVIIGQLIHDGRWRSALRIEYYQDKTGIIIPLDTSIGFKTSGFSYNLDYTPTSMLMCRLEARWFNSDGAIFQGNTMLKENTFFVSASMAIKFYKILNEQ